MFSNFFAMLSNFFATINPWLLVLGLLAFVFIFIAWNTHKSERLNWADMLTHDGPNNRVSMTKVLQLVGGVVGTWFIVQSTIDGKMNADYLMIYLAYVGAIEGWAKFVALRYGGFNSNGNGNGNGYGGYGSGYGGGYGGYRGNNGPRPLNNQTPPERTGGGLGEVSDAELDAALSQTTVGPNGSKVVQKNPN